MGETKSINLSNSAIYATSDDDVQSLMNEVSKIRAEIAALEGKSVEQVESEARSKRIAEKERISVAKKKEEPRTESKKKINGMPFPLPESATEQVRLAVSAAGRAYRDGISRQTVRFSLFPYESGNLLEMSQWPGGPQEMYRDAARPFTEEMLRLVRAESNLTSVDTKNSDLPPKIVTCDIWDFDGSALVRAESARGPSCDVQAMVLPNTDSKYTGDIDK